MKTLLETIYNHGLNPNEMCCPDKKEYHQTIELCRTLEQELKQSLPQEKVKMFDDFKEYYLRISAYENEENFIQGMALGVRMTSEAFIVSDLEKTTE